jgi:hypothetical protein
MHEDGTRLLKTFSYPTTQKCLAYMSERYESNRRDSQENLTVRKRSAVKGMMGIKKGRFRVFNVV